MWAPGVAGRRGRFGQPSTRPTPSGRGTRRSASSSLSRALNVNDVVVATVTTAQLQGRRTPSLESDGDRHVTAVLVLQIRWVVSREPGREGGGMPAIESGGDTVARPRRELPFDDR